MNLISERYRSCREMLPMLFGRPVLEVMNSIKDKKSLGQKLLVMIKAFLSFKKIKWGRRYFGKFRPDPVPTFYQTRIKIQNAVRSQILGPENMPPDNIQSSIMYIMLSNRISYIYLFNIIAQII